MSNTAAAAQLYRWVDEKGRVEWRDTPPPQEAKSVEKRSLGANKPQETSDLPYSLRMAVQNFPVTLWVTECGPACTLGRQHLARRGVPYTERNPQDDYEQFTKQTNGKEVPVLLVGSMIVKGYLDSKWDSTLDAAGYPKSAVLKPTNKPASTPGQARTEKERSPEKKGSAAPVRLYTSSDCGLNCDDARRMLQDRGIAFEEISIASADQIEQLRKLTGDTVIPVLVLEHGWLRGYSPSAYQNALDKAGIGRQP